jgi:hypothetical protein
MKTRLLFIILTGFMMWPVNSNGQIGSRLTNKIVNKIISNEIDSMDKKDGTTTTPSRTAPPPAATVPSNRTAQPASSTAKTEIPAEKEEENAAPTSFNFGGLGMGKVDIKYKDEYNFDGSIYTVMETYDKKDVTKMDYYTYFNGVNPDAAIEVKGMTDEKGSSESGTSVFVFDGENKCFLMLIENEDGKTGIISTIPNDSTLKAQNSGKQPAKPTIVKTGKTKVVAGYKCDEYRVTDVENKTYSNVWASKDVNLKADRTNWNRAGLPTYTTEFEGGMVLAMESYSNKDVLEMKMETMEIKNNIKHTVSPKGYNLIQMKFNQGR